ncbi:DNA polymerase IV [Sphingomonas sp. UNC305MFCol5.2]|uniref:DNA polymerase IV n=1 Tax=Sphingomonas sp. UNC305MFCol5.2 TaxID=1449076 RepID=UPI00055A1D0E|nr:DNA polymerase IV [Sphingomonas sp. UNC305MFCol5.2]
MTSQDNQPSANRKIIHIDMDAFYASVEQRDAPELRGRPVAVGYAAARGVVAAASYEARAFGVRSALPSVTALRRCPELVFVRPRFEVYKAVSKQIHAIFADYTELIQPLSLDEAYLDVTANRRGIETAWATAKEIRARILEETGLTASAGISYNKFLAKLASDQRKPNGQFAVTPEMGAAWVETLPVARFHGVGPVTAEKMKRLGIETGADLRDKSLDFLRTHFGSAAEWYFAIARGQDDRPVNPSRERKSSGSETTFDRDLTDPPEIEAGVLRMADDVWNWCDKAQAFGRTVTVKVKFADFRQITRSKSFASVVRTQELLRQTSRELIGLVLPPEKGIRLVGVTVSNFETEPGGAEALPLFGSNGELEAHPPGNFG